MFGPITIPYECVMLYNTATLKSEIDFDDVEFALAEMCALVKETYPDFIQSIIYFDSFPINIGLLTGINFILFL